MDPLDAPEPLGLFQNRELVPSRSGPTLVAHELRILDEEEIPWDEVMEDEFFTVEPAPVRAEDIDLEDEDAGEEDEDLFPRRRSRLPAVFFGSAIAAVVLGAGLLVAMSVTGQAEVEAATPEVVFVPPEPIVEAPPPVALDHGRERKPRRWTRRVRRGLPQRVVPTPSPAAPMRVSDLPPLSVGDLPRAQ